MNHPNIDEIETVIGNEDKPSDPAFYKKLKEHILNIKENLDMVILHGEYQEELYLCLDYLEPVLSDVSKMLKLIKEENKDD